MKIALILLLTLMPVSAFAFYGDDQVQVEGYYRSNGTYVQPYTRTRADNSTYNNYSNPSSYNYRQSESSRYRGFSPLNTGIDTLRSQESTTHGW